MGLRSITLSLSALALWAIVLPNVAPRALAQSQSAAPAAKPPYNIIFVISDQERQSILLVTSNDYELPARAELQRRGITFRNHYTASAMCTPFAGRLLQW